MLETFDQKHKNELNDEMKNLLRKKSHFEWQANELKQIPFLTTMTAGSPLK